MGPDVIWFADRLGNVGNIASLWLRELNAAGVKPTKVHTVSLHRVLKGQLLTRYANRQAPTWIPERAPAIKLAMLEEIRKAGPDLKAIVLCSPESLAILDLPADTATLGKLRGSVYSIEGIPALVCLPMSAWLSKVSLKEVQNANFGAMSREGLERLYETESDGDPTDDVGNGVAGKAGRSGNHNDGGGPISGNGASGNRGGGAATGVGGQYGNGGSAAGNRDGGGDAGRSDSVADEADQGLDEDDLDDSDDDDKFFYVPVVVPVGKMMIQFDLGKLGRIVNGKAGEQWKPV